MKLKTKKEIIYVLLAMFGSIAQLTWVQMAYNEPSFVQAWSFEYFRIILCISSVFVIYQTLITWKAYLSDPSVIDKPLVIPLVPQAPPPPANPTELNS